MRLHNPTKIVDRRRTRICLINDCPWEPLDLTRDELTAPDENLPSVNCYDKASPLRSKGDVAECFLSDSDWCTKCHDGLAKVCGADLTIEDIGLCVDARIANHAYTLVVCCYLRKK